MHAPLYTRQTVDEDRRITFCIHAPDAHAVQIEFGKPEGPEAGERVFALVRQDNGDWTVTTDPVRPGFHYYQVLVDGMKCSDPAAACYFGWGHWCSGIEIPDPEFSLHEPRRVPHGELRMHWYHSQITGQARRCIVYTPPGYDAQADTCYPVLYLQHGSGEAELSWPGQGRANFILDNLIAEGTAVPMLVVMDNGYAMPAGASADDRPKNRFGDVIVNELVPEIDHCFRTVADAHHRALAGLSMGAGQALSIGLTNLHLFGSVCAMSGGGRGFDPATSFGGLFASSSKANKALDVFWIGCGRQDGGFKGAQAMHEQLGALGVRHTWFECDGSHDWGVWRRHLVEVARALFRG